MGGVQPHVPALPLRGGNWGPDMDFGFTALKCHPFSSAGHRGTLGALGGGVRRPAHPLSRQLFGSVMERLIGLGSGHW